MAAVLLQLGLSVSSVIQLTSSQTTFDVIPSGNDVYSCDRSEQALNQLLKDVKQLQRDLAELKAANQQGVTECPADFKYVPSVNGCYQVLTSNVEWAVAGLECRSLHEDAHLLVINDAAEQSAVGEMLDSINQTTPECFARPSASEEYYGMVFWTAGQRIDPTSHSTFVWRVSSTDTFRDTLSVMTYSYWEPGQPSYWQQEEHCMHFSSKLSYQWNDCPCRSTLCSVCELDMRAN